MMSVSQPGLNDVWWNIVRENQALLWLSLCYNWKRKDKRSLVLFLDERRKYRLRSERCDLPSTSHQPPINLPSTSHQPPINLPSTSHQPPISVSTINSSHLISFVIQRTVTIYTYLGKERIFKNGFLYSALKAWNNPAAIRELSTLIVSKNDLKHSLKD